MYPSFNRSAGFTLSAFILALVCLLCGCGQAKGEEASAGQGAADEALPAAFTYIVPYEDIRSDGDEMGWYRPSAEEAERFAITKSAYCSDGEAVAKVCALVDTKRCNALGQINDDNRGDYDALNSRPAIHLVFDKRYFVSVYPNNLVVTQTFYTEGERYEQLADAYYAENGVYPPAISDGLWQYAAKGGTYEALQRLLLDLPPEQEPSEASDGV